MVFTRSFARDVPGSRFPEWVKVSLTGAEEASVAASARQEHIRSLKECIADARQILKDEQLRDYQTNLVQLAVALFEKRSSHVVWHKEEAAREKFEREQA